MPHNFISNWFSRSSNCGHIVCRLRSDMHERYTDRWLVVVCDIQPQREQHSFVQIASIKLNWAGEWTTTTWTNKTKRIQRNEKKRRKNRNEHRMMNIKYIKRNYRVIYIHMNGWEIRVCLSHISISLQMTKEQFLVGPAEPFVAMIITVSIESRAPSFFVQFSITNMTWASSSSLSSCAWPFQLPSEMVDPTMTFHCIWWTMKYAIFIRMPFAAAFFYTENCWSIATYWIIIVHFVINEFLHFMVKTDISLLRFASLSFFFCWSVCVFKNTMKIHCAAAIEKEKWCLLMAFCTVIRHFIRFISSYSIIIKQNKLSSGQFNSFDRRIFFSSVLLKMRKKITVCDHRLSGWIQ